MKLVPILAILMAGVAAGCGRHGEEASAVEVAAPLAHVARGRIDIEGGVQALGMAADGIVAAVLVKEGDHVSRGQILVRTDMTPAKLEETLARARLDQARAQLRLQVPRVAAAQQHAQRLQQAVAQDAADGQSADDARESATEAAAELQNARAGVELAQAQLQQAQYQLRLHALSAPADGQVLRMSAWPGMRVGQGVPLLTLLPDGARIVRAELSEEALAGVAPGTRAQVLADDGRQTPLANAHVLRLGATYGQSTFQDDPQQRVDERSVECILGFDAPTRLRVGQRVLVRFEPRTGERPAKPAAPRL